MALQLVGDIGGTNARLALVEGDLRLREVQVLATNAFASVDECVAHYLRQHAALGSLDRICVAVAGPVANGRARLTNAAWEFDTVALTAHFGVPVRLMNDFGAQAYGVNTLAADELHSLGGGLPVEDGLQLVLGPGTGMGMAALLRTPHSPSEQRAGSRLHVIGTEVGHADCAPGSLLEQEIMALLMQRFQRVTWEHVLTGPGLSYLYTAMAQMWGQELTEDLGAAEVTRLALEDEAPLAMHTLEVYVNWLGGFVGNQAVTFLARGGVYLVGAMVNRLHDLLDQGSFRRRFEDRAPLAALVRQMATVIVRDEQLGLRGAAAYCASE